MTSTEIRNQHKTFLRELEQYNQQIAKAKNELDFTRIAAQYQSRFNERQLEVQVEIAAQLAELNELLCKKEFFQWNTPNPKMNPTKA